MDAGSGVATTLHAATGYSGFERRRWKPPANHPWRQYRSVYLQKKRMDLVRERQAAECA
jgi:hypothetical protein